MKFKKPFCLALLCLVPIILIFTLASCNSFSETEYAIVGEGLTSDIFIYDQYENSTVKITGSEKMPAQLIIPEKIDGMTVVEIGESAFANNTGLLYLEFPSQNIKLGRGFCAGSMSLIAINFSGAVSLIPDNAFDGCVNLARVEGMENVTSIGEQAFADCITLSGITISDKLTEIKNEAFRGCTALSRITIPSSVTFIGESAFWGCEGLVAADIECSAEVPQYCFLSCLSLTSVKLGDGVTAIKEEAFRNCFNLYSLEIGKNCKNIGEYAFYGCDSLTEINFTDNKNITIGEGNESLNGNNQPSGEEN